MPHPRCVCSGYHICGFHKRCPEQEFLDHRERCPGAIVQCECCRWAMRQFVSTEMPCSSYTFLNINDARVKHFQGQDDRTVLIPDTDGASGTFLRTVKPKSCHGPYCGQLRLDSVSTTCAWTIWGSGILAKLSSATWAGMAHPHARRSGGQRICSWTSCWCVYLESSW